MNFNKHLFNTVDDWMFFFVCLNKSNLKQIINKCPLEIIKLEIKATKRVYMDIFFVETRTKPT